MNKEIVLLNPSGLGNADALYSEFRKKDLKSLLHIYYKVCVLFDEEEEVGRLFKTVTGEDMLAIEAFPQGSPQPYAERRYCVNLTKSEIRLCISDL